MKNLFIGLIIGLAVCAIIGYLKYPEVTQAGYDKGFAEGNKAGLALGSESGIKEGIAQGIAQEKNRQKGQLDSMSAAMKKRDQDRRAAAKPVEQAPAIQNWRVIGGNIAEPILDAESKERTEQQ